MVPVHFIAAYAELGNGNNLIAPFHVVGCWVHPEDYAALEILCSSWDLHNPYRYHHFDRYRKYIRQLKPYRVLVHTYTIEAYLIESIGLHVAAVKGLKAVNHYLKYRFKEIEEDSYHFTLATSSLTSLDVKEPDLLYIEERPFNVPQFAIACLHARYLRLYALRRIHSAYPYLSVYKHCGFPTRLHFNKLSKIDLLPPCYIASKTFNFAKNYIKFPYPYWYECAKDLINE